MGTGGLARAGRGHSGGPGFCDTARRLLYVVSRLAVWADSVGLPRDPGLWLRTETIDRFVLVSWQLCAGERSCCPAGPGWTASL
ncbi:hypothetical protein ABZ953_21375 [Streptomyces sp. NPDC046465]|uniref:hypothetical protein n=1 Tax=Streptomyces sp. NPDC046465 TaxID=3155810 RepID=UPI0033CD7E06